jgi:hypothetical protein
MKQEIIFVRNCKILSSVIKEAKSLNMLAKLKNHIIRKKIYCDIARFEPVKIRRKYMYIEY